MFFVLPNNLFQKSTIAGEQIYYDCKVKKKTANVCGNDREISIQVRALGKMTLSAWSFYAKCLTFSR